MGDFVYNVVGTSGRKCQCSVPPKTWIGHWQRGTGITLNLLVDTCYAAYCGRAIEVGAHVKLVGSDLRVTWIVPFCQMHNKRPSDEQIELKWGVMLCGAAAGVDCG